MVRRQLPRLLDFALDRADLSYCIVDVDYGCGIIFKNRIADISENIPPAASAGNLAAEWLKIHDDDELAFKFFIRNHKPLLLLMSAKTFIHCLDRKIATQLYISLQFLAGALIPKVGEVR